MAKGKGGFIGQDGLNAPDSPTGVSGSVGDTEIDVSFTAPTDVGGSAITGYRVQDSTGAHGASGSSSPITVTGLTNDTAYTFNVWAINAFGYSAPSDASESVSPAAPQYALIVFPNNGSLARFNMLSTGTFADFGDNTTNEVTGAPSFSSTTIAVWGGNADNLNMSYSTFATAGNTTDYGDMYHDVTYAGGASDDVRGYFCGGLQSGNRRNYIQWKNISSSGNLSDFGDLTVARQGARGCASPTRVLMGSGFSSGGVYVNTIDYFAIGISGNATDFGDLSLAGRAYLSASFSSSTRGIWAGGVGTSSYDNGIDYVTIASTGNASDFGDCINQPSNAFGLSNNTYGFIGGGYDNGSLTNTVQRITIASTGNATDWDDLSSAKAVYTSASSAHGGLQ